MEVNYCSGNIFRKAQSTVQYLIRYLDFCLIAILISFALTAKANAIYLLSDFSRVGTYIDRDWYYFLDHGQYHYLDKGQYHLIGELGYYLRHPFYPRLHEKGIDQTIQFTNTINRGWFLFLSYNFPVSEHNLPNTCYFNPADSIYRQRYYFSDIGKYNYLEKGQYHLLTTLTYSSGYPRYQRQFQGTAHPLNVASNPEPSTITFLGLGALGMIILRRNKSIKQ